MLCFHKFLVLKIAMQKDATLFMRADQGGSCEVVLFIVLQSQRR
jgi:hypothetical protein